MPLGMRPQLLNGTGPGRIRSQRPPGIESRGTLEGPAGKEWLGIRNLDGPVWEIFEDGPRVARVTFPPRVSPVHIGGSGILAVWRDDLDVERLVKMPHLLGGSG